VFLQNGHQRTAVGVIPFYCYLYELSHHLKGAAAKIHLQQPHACHQNHLSGFFSYRFTLAKLSPPEYQTLRLAAFSQIARLNCP
jgi:hypothetical protein